MIPNNCVLIVDDEESARDTLEALLAKKNYHLITALDGYDALTKASTYLPDLILLDVMMPGMDGFETCRKIRQDAILAEVPIILVTALDDRDSRIAGIESGADDFISKPYDKVELRARVHSVLRLNRYRKSLGERLKFEWIAEHTKEAFLLLLENDVISYANPQAQNYLQLTDEQIESGSLRFLPAVDKIFQRERRDWQFWLKGVDDATRPRYLVRPESRAAKEFWLRVDVLELPEHIAERRLLRLSDASAEITLQRKAWVFQDVIAHKLLTPLNALQGLTLLREEQLALLDREQQELIDAACRGFQRLTRQVQEVIHYVDRIARLVNTHEQTPVKSCLPLLNRLQEYLALSYRIKITLAPELERRIFAVGDELLELVLRELLTNAKKFHPQHEPKIQVIFTLDSQDSKLAACAVIDDGRRIPPERLAYLTQPYYQEEKFFTGEPEGMGLGLAMVSALMRGVGGYCRVRNSSDTQDGIEVCLGIPLL